MGETKKLVKKELTKALYDNMLLELNEEISKLTSEQKEELRVYVKHLSETAKIHSFANVFIARKIKQLNTGR